MQESRSPIADENVATRVDKELSLRFVYRVHDSIRPRGKQFLFDKYVDRFEEPGFVLYSFRKLDERICVKGWLRHRDLVLVLSG
jgi:hypothetical protein